MEVAEGHGDESQAAEEAAREGGGQQPDLTRLGLLRQTPAREKEGLQRGGRSHGAVLGCWQPGELVEGQGGVERAGTVWGKPRPEQGPLGQGASFLQKSARKPGKDGYGSLLDEVKRDI